MSELISPHGGQGLTGSLLTGRELAAEKEKALSLRQVPVSFRAVGDLLMIGNGGFSPLTGFMSKADWNRVCGEFLLEEGIFWPLPITLDVDCAAASGITEGDEVALVHPAADRVLATMVVTEKFILSRPEREWECEQVFMGKGTRSVRQFWDLAVSEHPGVQSVLNQQECYLAGPVKVFHDDGWARNYDGLFLSPEDTRKIFTAKGWSEVAALQLRNPMHRSHEYLAKTALEVSDGVLIHSLVGNLKPGDLPGDIRVRCIETLLDHYFVTGNVVHGVYPLDMRYAGPREALLHAVMRQNYGCSKMIVGRDHAGVANFYSPFEAHEIFDTIPRPSQPGHSLLARPLKFDFAFYCSSCDGIASSRTCPHGPDKRESISGSRIRKLLADRQQVPATLVRQEVTEILREYYQGLSFEPH